MELCNLLLACFSKSRATMNEESSNRMGPEEVEREQFSESMVTTIFFENNGADSQQKPSSSSTTADSVKNVSAVVGSKENLDDNDNYNNEGDEDDPNNEDSALKKNFTIGEIEESNLKRVFSQLCEPYSDMIELGSFIEYLKIDQNFAASLFQCISRNGKSISYEDLKESLITLFEPYFIGSRGNSPLTSPKPTRSDGAHAVASPAVRARAKRSFSFSRHYQIQHRTMLVYLYAASQISDASTSSSNNSDATTDTLAFADFRKRDKLCREIEWETKDSVLLTDAQIKTLLSSVGKLAVQLIKSVNPGVEKFKSQGGENSNISEHTINELLKHIWSESATSSLSASNLNLRNLFEWFQRHNPHFFTTLDMHLFGLFFGGIGNYPIKSYRGPLPTLPVFYNGVISNFLNLEEIWLITGILPLTYLHDHHHELLNEPVASLADPSSLHPTWRMLFNTDDQGHSIKQFEYFTFDYPGSTLVLIHAETKTKGSPSTTIILGVYVPIPWKARRKSTIINRSAASSSSSLGPSAFPPNIGWGHKDCLLFEVSPNLEVFPVTKRAIAEAEIADQSASGQQTVGPECIFLDSQAGLAFGLGNGVSSAAKTSVGMSKGSSSQNYVLFLDSSFFNGRLDSSAAGHVFQASRVRSFYHELDIIRLEVFGLSGEAAYSRWQREKKVNESLAERRQNINLKQDREVDQIILEMVGAHEFHPEERAPIGKSP